MSLQWELSRTIPEDTAAVGRAMLGEDDPYRVIGEHFGELFPEERVFIPLYEVTGRGAESPLLMSLVTILQMLEKLPDRVAARYAATRLDWKYALHLPLSDPGFHFTDLYAFRQRLLKHGWERQVFDELLARLVALGYLRPRGKMRTDSTHLLGAVEWLSRLELVLESIRLTLRALTKADPDWVERQLPPTFREVHGQRESLYGHSDAEVAAALPKAGADGFWLIEQLQRDQQERLLQLEEVRVLQQVLAQQFPAGGDQPPPSQRPSGSRVIQSPHDPDARQGVKRAKLWLGYKAQVSESCEADLPHLITDLAVGNALEQDSTALPAIQQRLQQRGVAPQEQYVDHGYLSGERIAESMQAGTRLLGPAPQDTHGTPGFRQTDFVLDEPARQATCPAGHTARLWREKRPPDAAADTPPVISIRFPAKTCQACAFFGRCTTSPQGRSLEVHPYRHLLQLYRQLAHSPDFLRALHIRAGMEATLSELTRKYDLRHARYRGGQKLRLQGAFTAAATNLMRMVRWWTQASPAPFAPA